MIHIILILKKKKKQYKAYLWQVFEVALHDLSVDSQIPIL